MEELPDELKFQLLLDVGYPGLRELCRTNQNFARICRDELLWRRLFERDFPDWEKNETKTWRESYLELWHDFESIRQFAQHYLETHLAIRPEYARIDRMVNDLDELIQKFFGDDSHDYVYNFDELVQLATRVARIALGLKDEYIGTGYQECDIRPFTDDARDELDTLLDRLGFTYIDELDTEDETGDEEDNDEEPIEYHGD